MKNNITFEKILLFLLFFYYLCPISVRFIKSIGIVLIYIMLIITEQKHFRKNGNNILLLLICWIALYSSICLIWGEKIISILQNDLTFFLTVMPSVLFFSFADRDAHFKKYLYWLAIIAMIIGSINSIIVLNIYPNASRLLAAGNMEDSIYGKMGVGGYGFIYGITFLLPALVKKLYNSNKRERIPIVIAIVSGVVLIIMASYTIALIFLVMMILVALLNKKWQKALVVILLIAAIFFIDNQHMGNIMLKISGLFPANSVLSKRFLQIAHGFLYEDVVTGTGGRFDLYLESLNAIKISPVFGTLLSGIYGRGHTSWLDLYATFGIFAIMYFYLLWFIQKKIYRFTSQSFIQFIYICFVILGFINPIHNQGPVCFVIFLVIPTLFIENAENKSLIKD